MARPRSAHPAIQLFPFLAVLVSVMGALIFLLLITSKRIPQVAMARARAAEARTVELPSAEPAPLPQAPDPSPVPLEPPQPLADLEPTGPTAAEIRAQEHEAARAAEQAALIDQWRQRIQTLQGDRDEWAANLQRQTLLTTAAERKQQQMLAELQGLEQKLGSLTGRVAVGSMQSGSVDKQRLQLEQRILGLRRQIKAVSDQQRAEAGKYSIVPYDGKSGTTRRPILIEVTSTGFRFVPENVFIGAGDIEGFTERQNPLLAGATALTQYWNQFNQQQGTVSADHQPYVLMIVRPSGTLGYYVSVRLLQALKQQHGYELVAEDVDLKWPAVDVGAQAACRAAVEGMLASRESMAVGSGSGGRGPIGDGGPASLTRGIPGEGRSSLDGLQPITAGGQAGTFLPGDSPSAPRGSRNGSNKSFELTDLEPRTEEIGSRSWEDPSRFGGLEHRRDKNRSTAGSGAATGSGGSSSPRKESSIPPSPAVSETGSKPARGAGSVAAAPMANGSQSLEQPEPAATEVATDSDREQWTAPQRIAPSPRPTPARPASRTRTAPPPADPEQRLARGPRRGNGQDIPYEQLQRRRWGQFEEGANIGVEKSVTIRVDAEQMIVANQLIIPIRPGASRNELFDYLLSAIDEHAASWGPAATGFFWIPSLKFVISPGGNQIYDRLAPLVTRSGLRADTEFTLERPSAPGQGARP